MFAGAVLLSTLLPALANAQVTLPLERYEELRAGAAVPPAPAPPAPLAFEEASLRVVVGRDSARVAQHLSLVLYAPGWHTVALPEAGSLLAAEVGGEDGLEGYVRKEPGEAAPRLAVRGIGRHRARLESVVAVRRDETATRAAARLTLPLPAAAVVGGTLEVPAWVRRLEAGAGAVVSQGEEGRWRFIGTPGRALELTLLGETAVPERSALPLRFEAVSAAALTITRTRHRLRAWLQARVLQGELDELVVNLPAGFEVLAVSGEPAPGWRVDGSRLRLLPPAPVSGELTLEVEMEGPPAVSFAAPVLLVEGAERAVLATGAAVRGDGLLELAAAGDGRRPQPASQLPREFVAAVAHALVVPAGGAPPRWQVTWAEGGEMLSTQVDRLLVEVLAGEDGRAFYHLWAELRTTGQRLLTFELPASLELVSARRDGFPLSPGRTSAAAGIAWAVPLGEPGRRQVIYLAGFLPLSLPEEGEVAVPLPRLSAPVARVEARVLLPADRRAELTRKERAGAVGRPPAAAPSHASQVRHLSPMAKMSPAVGPLEPPPGFSVLEAGWSALAPDPSPLVLQLAEPEWRKEWL